MSNKHASLNALFTDIADAIRAKEGSSDAIPASSFAERIAAIDAGILSTYKLGFTSVRDNNVSVILYDSEYHISNTYGFTLTKEYQDCREYVTVIFYSNSDFTVEFNFPSTATKLYEFVDDSSNYVKIYKVLNNTQIIANFS